MPATVLGKNLMLNAYKGTNPATPVTHGGLLTAQAPITAVTGTAATDVFAKTAHGLTNGDLVVLTAMTGGAGLVAGDAANANGLAEPLFVITANANDFQLSRTPGGTAVNFTTDITVLTVTKLVEVTGGAPAYARKAIAFNNAAEGPAGTVVLDDSTNGAVFDIPAAGVVNYQALYSAVTAGTLLGLDIVTQESYGAQGTYTVTDFDVVFPAG